MNRAWNSLPENAKNFRASLGNLLTLGRFDHSAVFARGLNCLRDFSYLLDAFVGKESYLDRQMAAAFTCTVNPVKRTCARNRYDFRSSRTLHSAVAILAVAFLLGL